ncbi:MAG: hypothetical protein ACLGHL_03915 [Actinomycetota bacterium]
MSHLLYLVAEACDGNKDHEQIARAVSEEFGRTVSADNVEFLVDKKLRPLGVLAQTDGSSPEVSKGGSLLALKFKKTLVPEKAVAVLAAMMKPLFWPPVVLAVLAGLVAVDVWYFSTHGVGGSIRDLLYQPLLVMAIYALLIVSIGWHEFGHATACRYGGADPGVIGFGIYLVWPAFYTDVTDAYRLGKGGRVRTDLGGIYYNAIFSLVIAAAYLLTRFEPILLLILLQHLLMLYNFIPFLRMDGYYVIADLTGVPDLFARVKPTLKSLVPGQETEEAVTELKTWVRVVVTLWVVIVVPLLLYLFAMMIISLPRVLATGWDSFNDISGKFSDAWADGDWAKTAVNGLQVAFLALPMFGMLLTIWRVSKRVAVGAWNVTEGHPIARTLVGIGVTACALFAAFVLWPNGEYRPIQEGERWTLTESFSALSESSTGRPSLTEERQEEFGGAPGVSEAFAPTESDTQSDTEEEQPEAEASPAEGEEVVSPEPTPTPEATP